MAEPTIFVVDDDEAVRHSLHMLLTAQGFSVNTYPSAQEFLDAAVVCGEGVLLLDVRMPGLSGLDLQAKLRAKRDHLPIVFITAFGDVPLAVDAMKAGAVDFLEKPFTKAAILNCIGRALNLGTQVRTEDRFAADAKTRVESLTPRERQVLERVVSGRQSKAIAFDLGISVRTVENHRARIMGKMEAESVSHLVRMALAAGVVPGEPHPSSIGKRSAFGRRDPRLAR
jgi:two-component system response regulator FixJ